MGGMPAERVETALEELLGWPALARSPQLARFLSYIVSATLKGEESGIKAYSIAVDVFGRPPTFDPQSDPIVRVQARRLRALLDQFYDEGLGRTGVRIHLPVGRYIPEFLPLEMPAAGTVPGDGKVATDESQLAARESPQTDATGLAATSSPAADRVPLTPPVSAPAPQPVSHATQKSPDWRIVGVTAAFALIAVALAAYFVRPAAPPGPVIPQQPTVLVGDFANLTGTADFDRLGTELAGEVTAMLSRFEDFRTERLAAGQAGARTLGTSDYLVSGIINPLADGIEVTATLTAAGGKPIWTRAFSRPVPGTGESIASTAEGIVREIAPYRGPVSQSARQWLDDQQRPLPAVNGYVCLLTYRLARETGSSMHIADALGCAERLLKEQPDEPLILSADAWLRTRADVTRNMPEPGLPEQLAPLAQQAERALRLRPDSSLIHEHLGAIYNWQQRFDVSGQEYATSIQLNPLNTDARAGYAIALSRAMEWVLGAEQAELAIEGTAYPSPWYYYPAGVNALREGRYPEAVAAGRLATQFAGGEIGAMIALAGASMTGQQDVIDEMLPKIMHAESLRRAGILPWLAAMVTDPAVQTLILDGLRRAGVPEAALTAPF